MQTNCMTPKRPPLHEEPTQTMEIQATAGKPYYKHNRATWACMIDLGTNAQGKRIRREITAKTKTALLTKRREALQETITGAWTPGRKPTLHDWATYWLDNIAAPRIRPRVHQNYRSYIHRHISPTLGDKRLDKITPVDIRALHATMAKRGLSSRSIQAVHNTLAKILRDAVREGTIATNPADRMDRPQAHSTSRQAYSPAEVKAILATAKERGAREYSRWLAALHLGLRQGERLALEWDRVDLINGVIHAVWQVQRIPWKHGAHCPCEKGRQARRCPVREPDAPAGFEIRPCHHGVWFTRPKTATSERLTPMTRELQEALTEWKAHTTGWGLVWSTKGAPIEPKRDRDEWRELCAEAGVRRMDVHSARHTAVSMLLERGAHPEVIRQIVGHSSVLATRQYMHVSTDQARAALDLL